MSSLSRKPRFFALFIGLSPKNGRFAPALKRRGNASSNDVPLLDSDVRGSIEVPSGIETS
jgi:hypothetical protein